MTLAAGATLTADEVARAGGADAFFWTEEIGDATFARMEEFLDGPAALLVPLNRDLYAIAEEELSAYLGGLGSPEDCAAKIRSRASVWLAENQ